MSETHLDLMVPRAEVELGEEARAVKFVSELVNHRDGDFVLNRASVECPVVNAEAPQAIGLLNQEIRRGEGVQATVDDALGLHVAALAFQLILVASRVAVRSNRDGGRVW